MPAETKFRGISPEAVWLLAENRFRDSKRFYEENKPKIRAGILEPLRDLLEDLAPAMLKIDGQIVTAPGRNSSISRVRRDNRYTHDKSMYRENMWIVFKRDKEAFDYMPGFYADVSPKGTEWGMGFYQAPPAFLQFFRRRIDADPAPYRRAVKRALAAGFRPDGEAYARPKKPDADDLLDPLYNRKGILFMQIDPDVASFGGPDLVERLRTGFAALAPLYRLLTADIEAWTESRTLEEAAPGSAE